MRFRLAHKMSTYLMVVATVANLALAEALSLQVAVLLIVVGAISWNAEPGTRLADAILRYDLLFKASAVAVFLYSSVAIYRSFPDPEAQQLVNLIVFLLGLKLLQRRTNRDYLQLFILSFLLLLASAWLTQTALFALGFAAYVITSIWALILFHLRREIEDNYLVKHSESSSTQRVTVARVLDSRRVVGGRFFAVTALSSVGVLLGSTLVFALAPRIGLGFLTGGVRRRTNVVGFSDEVRLGQHGRISSENYTVVMRAALPRLTESSPMMRDSQIANLYWRGTVYDTYTQGQWLRSRANGTETHVEWIPSSSGGNLYFVFNPETEERQARYGALKGTDLQEIQVVGLSHPVAFGLDMPVAYELDRTPVGAFTKIVVEPRWSGESALRMEKNIRGGPNIPPSSFAGATYKVHSRSTSSGSNSKPVPASEALTPEHLKIHLAVPATLSPRTRELAEQITARHTTDEMKARAVIEWLHQNKKYTIDLKRNEDILDPVEDFLFEQDAGHCEYFASSLALLLRIVGIPTRYVNGFLGGEWNDITKRVTIYDNRAHSWVEAYLDGAGWTRLDATPPAIRSTQMGSLSQIMDSIELWWATWVIEYNAARQVQLGRDLMRNLSAGRRRPGGLQWPKIDWKQVILGVATIAALAYLVREIRRRGTQGGRRAARGRKGSALRFYTRALVALERAGLSRGEAETPRELLSRARRKFSHSLPPLTELTAWYERARFGEQQLDAAVLEEMDMHLGALQRLLAEFAGSANGTKRPRAA